MNRCDIVYLVSRFPVTSETFILREIEALQAMDCFDIELRSLFPAPDQPVHRAAFDWTRRLVRPSAAAGAAGFGWAAATRPRRLARVLRQVISGYRHSPNLLARAMITVLLACAHARGLAARRPAPHIHAHYATYPALAAWVCHELIGTSYSFTAHAHDLYVDTSMLDRKVADARFVVTISEYNRALLRRIAGDGTPIHVIHAGIDVPAYPFRPRRIPTSGPVRALTVASLQEYKGHAVLLEALARGGPGVERITVDLIGDGALRADLETLTAALGLGGRVRFLGSRSQDEVRAALDAADLFVLPSVVAADGQMEGLPVALMEALACGVPTVSTALSGIPEIVVDNVTGLLAVPGDAVSLNTALTAMTEADTERFGRAGRELVVRDFDLHRTIDALADLLRQTCR